MLFQCRRGTLKPAGYKKNMAKRRVGTPRCTEIRRGTGTNLLCPVVVARPCMILRNLRAATLSYCRCDPRRPTTAVQAARTDLRLSPWYFRSVAARRSWNERSRELSSPSGSGLMSHLRHLVEWIAYVCVHPGIRVTSPAFTVTNRQLPSFDGGSQCSLKDHSVQRQGSRSGFSCLELPNHSTLLRNLQKRVSDLRTPQRSTHPKWGRSMLHS